MENNYLIWINEFIINRNGIEYDFLQEMFPSIKELYNLRKEIMNSKETHLNKEELHKVYNIDLKIKEELKNNFIPEYILIKEKQNTLNEPISGINLDIPKKILLLRKIENDNIINLYVNSLTIEMVDSIETNINKFMKKTKAKEKTK